MSLKVLLPVLIACTLVSAIAIAMLHPLAESMRLLDQPDDRKRHAGSVPMIGGIAIFAAMLSLIAWPGIHLGSFNRNLLGTAGILVLFGVFDDRHNLSVRVRVIAQVVASLWMVFITGVQVHDLGDWLGWHVMLPPVVGVPFTIIAVIGLLNAFNMIDGINGLAGSMALVAVLSMVVLGGQGDLILPVMVMGVAMIPYLICNLGLFGPRCRIFLGDAGSTLIGYVLAWALIRASQEAATSFIRPTEVLWCVAIPVLDTLAVMIRRIASGASPFKPDRGHIHHLMLNAGMYPKAVLPVLVLSALALFGVGRALLAWWPSTSGSVFVLLLMAYTAVATLIYRRQHRQRAQLRLLQSMQRAPARTSVRGESCGEQPTGITGTGN